MYSYFIIDVLNRCPHFIIDVQKSFTKIAADTKHQRLVCWHRRSIFTRDNQRMVKGNGNGTRVETKVKLFFSCMCKANKNRVLAQGFKFDRQDRTGESPRLSNRKKLRPAFGSTRCTQIWCNQNSPPKWGDRMQWSIWNATFGPVVSSGYNRRSSVKQSSTTLWCFEHRVKM